METYTIYEMRKKAPLWWFNKSSDLRACAGTLWLGTSSERSVEIVKALDLGEGFSITVAAWPVYQMLCGMSLELIFKAISVAMGNSVTHTHELVELARNAELIYSDEVKGILDVLTQSIIWEGRYPVPKKEETLLKTQELSWDNLFSASENLGMFKKYNDALSWEAFTSIWSIANAQFWKYNSQQCMEPDSQCASLSREEMT